MQFPDTRLYKFRIYGVVPEQFGLAIDDLAENLVLEFPPRLRSTWGLTGQHHLVHQAGGHAVDKTTNVVLVEQERGLVEALHR